MNRGVTRILANPATLKLNVDQALVVKGCRLSGTQFAKIGSLFTPDTNLRCWHRQPVAKQIDDSERRAQSVSPG